MLFKSVEVSDTLMKIKAGVIELSKWICYSFKKMYQKMPKQISVAIDTVYWHSSRDFFENYIKYNKFSLF